MLQLVNRIQANFADLLVAHAILSQFYHFWRDMSRGFLERGIFTSENSSMCLNMTRIRKKMFHLCLFCLFCTDKPLNLKALNSRQLVFGRVKQAKYLYWPHCCTFGNGYTFLSLVAKHCETIFRMQNLCRSGTARAVLYWRCANHFFRPLNRANELHNFI